MKRLILVLACVGALLSGCKEKTPKEVPLAAQAEAASLVNEAQFATQIREHARAEELLQRAVRLNDTMPEYWVALGMARRRQDNKDGARKAYKKALEMHAARYKKEKHPEDLAQQAWVLALLGRKDEALKVLQKGLQDHPDSPVMKKMADPRGLPKTFENADFKALTV